MAHHTLIPHSLVQRGEVTPLWVVNSVLRLNHCSTLPHQALALLKCSALHLTFNLTFLFPEEFFLVEVGSPISFSSPVPLGLVPTIPCQLGCSHIALPSNKRPSWLHLSLTERVQYMYTELFLEWLSVIPYYLHRISFFLIVFDLSISSS